jgi:hypothetical protein
MRIRTIESERGRVCHTLARRDCYFSIFVERCYYIYKCWWFGSWKCTELSYGEWIPGGSVLYVFTVVPICDWSASLHRRQK